MSVVELAGLPEIRTALDPLVDAIPYSRTVRASRLVPSGGRSTAGLVGTAFDYGLRFMLQRRCPSANIRRWVAERAAAELTARWLTPFTGTPPPESRPSVRIAKRAAFRVRNAQIFLRKHLKRRAIDEPWLSRLAVHALKLARLDPYVRANYFDRALVATDDPQVVNEVAALLRLVPLERLCDEPLWLNPTFGEHSRAFGGADADIIAGTRLVELKTRAEACVERQDVRQLLLYAMLADFARESGLGFPCIDTLEIYFARHQTFVTLNLAPVRRVATYVAARTLVLATAERRYLSERRPVGEPVTAVFGGAAT